MTEREKEPTINDFMKKVYNRRFQSVWTATLGKNQTGKTDFNLFQFELIHELGLADAFGSNIPDLDTSKLKHPFEIEFIEDFQTLKQRCIMLNPDPKKHGLKRYFFLADEMGNWAPQDQPWLNVKFIRELQQVRKYGLCVIATAIDRVDSRILNEKHFHGVFHKVSKANPTIGVYEDWTRYKRVRLVDIPRTKIDFDTFYSATFYMEPPIPTDTTLIHLNPEHEDIIKYLEYGNIKDTGIHRQRMKASILKVLRYHATHCLKALPQLEENSQPTKETRESKEEQVPAS